MHFLSFKKAVARKRTQLDSLRCGFIEESLRIAHVYRFGDVIGQQSLDWKRAYNEQSPFKLDHPVVALDDPDGCILLVDRPEHHQCFVASFATVLRRGKRGEVLHVGLLSKDMRLFPDRTSEVGYNRRVGAALQFSAMLAPVFTWQPADSLCLDSFLSHVNTALDQLEMVRQCGSHHTV